MFPRGTPIRVVLQKMLVQGILVEGKVALVLFDQDDNILFGETLVKAIAESGQTIECIVLRGFPSNILDAEFN